MTQKRKMPCVQRDDCDLTLEDCVKGLLCQLGEDPEREGLLKTPQRVAESLRYLTKGYQEDLTEVINGAIFVEDARGLVLLRDVKFFSLCEHHMLPFFGVCHLAYVPDGKIIGLSKLARVVDIFARRLQVQERLTQQIAGAIQEILEPKGVAITMEANHLCMAMRGVEKYDSITTTTHRSGVFEGSDRWTEFLTLCRRP
jgi:GTP cyclohydrolase I